MTAQKYGCQDIIRYIARKTLQFIYSYLCVAKMAVSKHCTYIASCIYLLNNVPLYPNNTIGI